MRKISVVALCLTGLCASVQAQDLEYTSTTQISMSPSMGAMGSSLAGGRGVSSHVYVKGSRARIEVGTGATIFDAAQQRMILLDNARRLYRILPLREPRDTRSDSLAAAYGAAVSVQPTREVKRVNGVDARRTNIIVRVPARNPKAPRASDLIVVNELWTSDTNGIGAAFDRVARFADQMRATGAVVFGMMTQNPRAGAAMHKATQAAAQIHGMPVRTVLAYGNIAAGSRFVMGMKLDTMMSVVTNVTDVRSASLSKRLFEIPPGYSRATQ